MQVIIEPFNFSFFSISGWFIDLEYCDIELFALKTNRDNSVIFEIVLKYCILHYFVDYEGYSISSMGFLSTVVEIIVIEFCQENALLITSTLFQQHKRRLHMESPGGQH